jgi:predicted CXXCH cytochrome family protein
MHGPVAIGHCATCHAAHRSRYEHVLRAPAPELCFQCHQASEPGQTLGCPRESNETDCTTCHHGHGGDKAYFLVRRPKQETESPQPPSPPSGKAE